MNELIELEIPHQRKATASIWSDKDTFINYCLGEAQVSDTLPEDNGFREDEYVEFAMWLNSHDLSGHKLMTVPEAIEYIKSEPIGHQAFEARRAVRLKLYEYDYIDSLD